MSASPEVSRLVLELKNANGSSVPMEFVKITIPKEGLLMGERGRYDDEEPIHRVTLASDFWLGETPVTQKQFAVWTSQHLQSHKNHFAGNDTHPAENMSWAEANQFCEWLAVNCSEELQKHSIQLVCLPTEAEWEFACRAGTDTEYYTGDGEAALDEAGWYDGNLNRSTQPVGMREPNKFGLYDMHGNVWELCHDEWNSKIYRAHVDGDEDSQFKMRASDWEKGVKNFTKKVDNDEYRDRVVRGGSWFDSPDGCRSAYRDGVWWSGGRAGDVGFRVCLVPGPLKTES